MHRTYQTTLFPEGREEKRVHRGGGRKPGEIDRLMPSDDEIWLHRNRSWKEWHRRTGLARETLKREFANRGWIKAAGGLARLEKGPCKACGVSTPVDDLDTRRECPCCHRANAETSLYRQEFDQWLERRPEMVRRMQLQRLEEAGAVLDA